MSSGIMRKIIQRKMKTEAVEGLFYTKGVSI